MRSCSARAAIDVDAVHEEGERHARARRALAVAGQGGHGVERAGLGVTAVARDAAAHPVVERAAAPGHRERGLERRAGLVAGHVLEQPHHLARRRAVGAREARAVRDPRAQPEARHRAAHHGGARARGAARAELLAERLDQRLRVEVVRRAVGEAGDLGHRRRGALGQRQRGRRGPPGARGAADHDVAALERAREGAGGEQRRRLLPVRAPGAGAAAVEGQRAQRPDLVRGPVALGRRAAQGVPGRLVADHAARDLAQAVVEHELVRELGRLALAEVGIATAAQVEVADQHAARVDPDVAERARRQVAVDAVERERGGGRVELLDGRRGAGGVGAPRVDRPPAVEVDRQRAGAAAREAHLGGQRGARGGRPRGERGGGRERGHEEQRDDEVEHPSHRRVEGRQPAGRVEVAVAFRRRGRDSRR